LFKAVIRAGGAARAEVPVEQRPAIAAIMAEHDPRRQLALYAATQPPGTDGSIKVWDASTGQELLTLSFPGGAVPHAAFSPDGSRPASGQARRTARRCSISRPAP
jgi:hypothetical protein